MLADGVGLDLEVEVHADLLEEVILDGDESDLDRDLQVLEPAELAEQVGDLLVDLGRVADDQADAQEERRDGTDRPGDIETAGIAAERTAQSVRLGDIGARSVVDLPGARRDRRRDQLDQRRQVNPPPVAVVAVTPQPTGVCRAGFARGRVAHRVEPAGRPH